MGSRGVNFHQLTLNSDAPLPPVNLRKRSCVPIAPLTVHVVVIQVCAPPVLGTVHVPTSMPVWLSSLASMLPPLAVAATRASNDTAPVRKSTPFTLM
jgi:hypothetical protein